jgi:hypothetical protein
MLNWSLLAIGDRSLVQGSEVQSSGGFLPICANCKKIRDDKGYWNQIEIYIGAH